MRTLASLKSNKPSNVPSEYKKFFGLSDNFDVANRQLDELTASMLTGYLPLIAKQQFSFNCYQRELFIPKGTLAISMMHKFPYVLTLVSGHATQWTAHAGVEDVHGFYSSSEPAGARRILYAHSDLFYSCSHYIEGLRPEMHADESEMKYVYACETYAQWKEEMQAIIDGRVPRFPSVYNVKVTLSGASEKTQEHVALSHGDTQTGSPLLTPTDA